MSLTDRYSVTTTPPDAIHGMAGPREVLAYLRDRLGNVSGGAVSWSVIDWSTGRRFGGEVDGTFGDRGLQEHLADVRVMLDALLWDLIGPYPLWTSNSRSTDPGSAALRAHVHVDDDGFYFLDILDASNQSVRRSKTRYSDHRYVDLDDLQQTLIWLGYVVTGPWVLWAPVLPLPTVPPGTPPGTAPHIDPAGPPPIHVRVGQVQSPSLDLTDADEHLFGRGLHRVAGWCVDADIAPAIDWEGCLPDPTEN